MIEKIKTLYWFFCRPNHWGHLFFLISRKFQNNYDSEELRSQSTIWAKKRSVSTEKALKSIGVLEDNESLDLFIDPSLIEEAANLARQSKVEMGGEGSLNLIYSCALLNKSKRAVETGVAYGWSSLAFLVALSKVNSSELVSVDMPYPKMNNEEFVGIAVPKRLRSNWKIFREPDKYGINKALKYIGGTIDICHYDSDKSYQGRKYAYPLLWNSLSIGGIFISDDIQDNFAFRDFVISKKLTFAVTEHQGKYIGVVKK